MALITVRGQMDTKVSWDGTHKLDVSECEGLCRYAFFVRICGRVPELENAVKNYKQDMARRDGGFHLLVTDEADGFVRIAAIGDKAGAVFSMALNFFNGYLNYAVRDENGNDVYAVNMLTPKQWACKEIRLLAAIPRRRC